MSASEKTHGYRIIIQRDGANTIRAWRGKKGIAWDAAWNMLDCLTDVIRFTITDVASGEIIAVGDANGLTNCILDPLKWSDF